MLLLGVIIQACITAVNSMSCDENWLEYQGKCFKHYNKRIDWTGAQGTCDHFREAQLATVDSPDTNMFIQHNLTDGSGVWIGLSTPDISKPSWMWSDGGDTSYYDDWTVADVNSACAVIKYDNGERYWYTISCTNRNYYVCEKEMSEDNCYDWLSFDAHCYLIIIEPAETNMVAARICWQHDAYLISINRQPEADFIYSIIETNTEYWIGLSPMKWVSGEPYQWNNWGDSGPNNSMLNGCVFIDLNGKWSSGHCGNVFLPNTHRPYICQKDADNDYSTTSIVTLEVYTSTNIVLGESYTDELNALNISTTQSSIDDSKQLLLTALVPAVCGGIVVIIVISVIVIVIRRKKRILSSQDAKDNEPVIYYNDIKKTSDNGHDHTKDSQTSSPVDTERNTYEQLSVGPYVNGHQITAGTYASLQ